MEYLALGDKFNQDIHNLPDSIKSIRIGLGFESKIYKLPENLETLYLPSFNGLNGRNLVLKDHLPEKKPSKLRFISCL